MKKVLDILDSIQEVHCTEYANEKIDEAIKELEELKNRSCNNCKYFNKKQVCNIFIARSGYKSNTFYCSEHKK